MTSQDPDTLIDTVAREMVSGDPGRSFTYGVMSRICERAEPAPNRLLWSIGTASAVAICAIVAMVMMNRADAPAPQMPRPESQPQARAVAQTATPPPALEPVVAPPVTHPSIRGRLVPPLVIDAPALEPLIPDPIVLSALDLPPLENEASSIENIPIDDITIEPLVASND